MTDYMVILPSGDAAEVLNSAAVTRPHVVTQAQMEGIAKAVEALRAADLPVDLEGLLDARPVGVPPPTSAHPVAAPAPEPALPPAPPVRDSGVVWGCTCGKLWTEAAGGRPALLEHQRTCGLWNDRGGKNLPAEYDAAL